MQTVRKRGYDVAYGFGYDSDIDDYKVVAISDNGGCSNVEVYSVRSNSRSNIQCTVKYSFHGGYQYGCPGVFFNGALHWLGSIANQETSSEVILCYDISIGIMVNMPLPDILPMPPTYVSEKVCKNVGVLGDCIFVAFIWRSVRMDVWVMREYGVNESWFRKYTTTQLPLSLYPSAFWKPLWCFDGEVLVDDGTEHFLLFDPTTETFRSVVVSDIAMDSLRNRVTYVESIASLGSGTYLKRQIKDGTGKNPKRQRLR
ncbi:F-box/kelch-repeat protein At3g06240-like [Papaver somniferum]|uniref:F-box/kelch-repeat protein At3g06240-like n=1 Tax=Papaver somniferum TaxID=3469 RepID=UPI000E702817|nr:F-box/kelch-repeat protein At3g06240-like [Papaver somniferum]